MRWDGPAIARFAREAGFHGTGLTGAVTVALLTSEGDDLYTFPGYPSHVVYVGLFGIPVPPDAADETVGWLLNPQHNAMEAYALWRNAGDTFDWSPAHRSPRWVAALQDAVGAVLLVDRPLTAERVIQGDSEPQNVPAWLDEARRLIQDVHVASGEIRRLLREGS